MRQWRVAIQPLKHEQAEADRKQAADKAPEQNGVVYEQHRAQRPKPDATVQDAVQGERAADQCRHGQGNEDAAGELDRNEVGEGRDHAVHREVGQDAPMDTVIAGQRRDLGRVDQDPCACEVIGIVDERRDPRPQQG